MLFLVDEDSAAGSIVATLRRLGHTVHLATEALPRGAPDVQVAGHAETLGAIVVTRNKEHFWRYLQPRPDQTPRKFARAGGLFLMCKQHHVSDRRITQFDTVLRSEHERVMASADPRLLVELHDVRVIIHR